MKIACFSDTHTYHQAVNVNKEDNIDILICAGDFSHTGKKYEVEDFMEWFKKQPSRYKVLIAGNHEITFDDHKMLYGGEWVEQVINDFTSNSNNYYLKNQTITIEGIKIFGSPITPWFYGERWAFNEYRGDNIKQVWDLIEEGTDIIITHGPPKGILDWVKYGNVNVGCEDLLNKVLEIKSKLHIFGHIHIDPNDKYDSNIEVKDGITFINASICDNQYAPVNKLTIIEI